MRRLAVCSFLESQPDGAEFAASALPLHVTLLGNSSCPGDVEHLLSAMESAARHLPLTVEASQLEKFGLGHNIDVTTLEDSVGLRELHHLLRSAFAAAGAVLDEPFFAGPGFRPHITHVGDRSVAVGTEFQLTALSLVDLRPDDDPERRQVIASSRPAT